jgi:VanZ family protein
MRDLTDEEMRLQRVGLASAWDSPLVDVGIWLIALVATAATLWFSLGPTAPGHGFDKALHATAYFVDTLAILLALVWRPGRDKRRFESALWVALAVLAAGGLIELVQGGFAHRDAQFADWIADAVGIGLAVLVFAAARKTLGEARPTSAG